MQTKSGTYTNDQSDACISFLFSISNRPHTTRQCHYVLPFLNNVSCSLSLFAFLFHSDHASLNPPLTVSVGSSSLDNAPTLDLELIACCFAHQHGGSLSVQRVRWVGVAQQLRQEDLKDIDHVYIHKQSKVLASAQSIRDKEG